MEHVDVEWSDVPLSRIGFGCELLGGSDWGTVDLEQAVAAVRAAFDSGVTVFDTADVYGLGRSEETLARALGGHAADVVVVTKGGIAWAPAETGARSRTHRDLSSSHLGVAVRESLRRLRIEQIPLYLAHWPDQVHGAHEVVETLLDLRQQGLIGAIGLSNFPASELDESGVIDRLDAVELEHSLICPGGTVLEVARTAGVHTLAYGSLAQGLLTGKYRPGHLFSTDDRRHRLTHFQDDTGAHERLISAIGEAARASGRSYAQVAIRWALDSGPTDCVIVGARDPRQLADSLAAGQRPLSDHERQRLDRVAFGHADDSSVNE